MLELVLEVLVVLDNDELVLALVVVPEVELVLDLEVVPEVELVLTDVEEELDLLTDELLVLDGPTGRELDVVLV